MKMNRALNNNSNGDHAGESVGPSTATDGINKSSSCVNNGQSSNQPASSTLLKRDFDVRSLLPSFLRRDLKTPEPPSSVGLVTDGCHKVKRGVDVTRPPPGYDESPGSKSVISKAGSISTPPTLMRSTPSSTPGSHPDGVVGSWTAPMGGDAGKSTTAVSKMIGTAVDVSDGSMTPPSMLYTAPRQQHPSSSSINGSRRPSISSMPKPTHALSVNSNVTLYEFPSLTASNPAHLSVSPWSTSAIGNGTHIDAATSARDGPSVSGKLKLKLPPTFDTTELVPSSPGFFVPDGILDPEESDESYWLARTMMGQLSLHGDTRAQNSHTSVPVTYDEMYHPLMLPTAGTSSAATRFPSTTTSSSHQQPPHGWRRRNTDPPRVSHSDWSLFTPKTQSAHWMGQGPGGSACPSTGTTYSVPSSSSCSSAPMMHNYASQDGLVQNATNGGVSMHASLKKQKRRRARTSPPLSGGHGTVAFHDSFSAGLIDEWSQQQHQQPLSASSTSSGTIPDQKKVLLYKTELCRSFEETGKCKFGQRCLFAHGKLELREIQRHPRYKTEICKSFFQDGICKYGKRCCFLHEMPQDNEDVQ